MSIIFEKNRKFSQKTTFFLAPKVGVYRAKCSLLGVFFSTFFRLVTRPGSPTPPFFHLPPKRAAQKTVTFYGFGGTQNHEISSKKDPPLRILEKGPPGHIWDPPKLGWTPPGNHQIFRNFPSFPRIPVDQSLLTINSLPPTLTERTSGPIK